MADTSTRRPAMRRGRGPTFEKPKDFKGTFKKLLKYLMQFKAACVVVVIAALCSTLFNVVGPKILGMLRQSCLPESSISFRERAA